MHTIASHNNKYSLLDTITCAFNEQMYRFVLWKNSPLTVNHAVNVTEKSWKRYPKPKGLVL